ncbi:MAG TPA: rod shape-determining protein MreD [Prolixibacteraceae bacterium]|nr:rod shape-determining protein MreD [Prolixibacteraceae bacterium]
MIKNPLWHIILFVTVVLIQVLFMNNIQFSRLVNPYFYVLFILLIPINTPRYLLLLSGFLLGFTIDIFSNTPGIHASATVFMAFVRPFVVNVSNVDEDDTVLPPSVATFGFSWFVRYAVILILLHHFFLFFIEIFSVQNFLQTFLRSFFSAIFTFVFVLISQFLMFRK